MHALLQLVCSVALSQAIECSCCSHIATSVREIRGTVVPLWLLRLEFLLLQPCLARSGESYEGIRCTPSEPTGTRFTSPASVGS